MSPPTVRPLVILRPANVGELFSPNCCGLSPSMVSSLSPRDSDMSEKGCLAGPNVRLSPSPLNEPEIEPVIELSEDNCRLPDNSNDPVSSGNSCLLSSFAIYGNSVILDV